jgi:hypothetical protein
MIFQILYSIGLLIVCCFSQHYAKQATCIQDKVDFYGGGDLGPNSFSASPNFQDCQEVCQMTEGCNFWTWWRKRCHVKSTKGEIRPNADTISGPKFCNSPEQPPRPAVRTKWTYSWQPTRAVPAQTSWNKCVALYGSMRLSELDQKSQWACKVQVQVNNALWMALGVTKMDHIAVEELMERFNSLSYNQLVIQATQRSV